MSRPLQYTGPTPNPVADAANHDDDLEAADDLHETASRMAPGIVLKQLLAITKPRDWWDKFSFHGGNSAEDILQNGMSVNDDIADRYSEFIIDATPAARNEMLKVMANWFAGLYSLEIYEDWRKDLSND